MKPRIGIITRYNEKEKQYFSTSAYVLAIAAAGGVPVQLPLVDSDDADSLIGCVDGLLITGGPDVSPLLYEEEPCQRMGGCCQHNDLMEFALLRSAVAAGKPVLGICRGLQVINVAYGGTLYQDIPSQLPGSLLHLQNSARGEATHTVQIVPGSYAHEICGSEKIYVNTFHHQSVKEVGKTLKITANAPDGIVEAIENDDGSVFAVQWHPENMYEEHPEHRAIFEKFVQRCMR